jgi:hypothetical protein
LSVLGKVENPALPSGHDLDQADIRLASSWLQAFEARDQGRSHCHERGFSMIRPCIKAYDLPPER